LQLIEDRQTGDGVPSTDMGRLTETRSIRVAFAGMAAYTAVNTWYHWTQASTAVDLTWFYWVAFPVALVALLIPVVSDRTNNLHLYFAPPPERATSRNSPLETDSLP
jgi:hypothetical protein